MTITPEFSFVVDCCRRNFPAVAGRVVASPGGLDWRRVLRLARFHRVQGLVWKAMPSSRAAIPGDVSRALAADAEQIAAANLHTALECRELLGLFEAAGIDCLFVKGLTLGALAYGRNSPKSGIDIDLLVDRPDLAEAAKILRERGYRPAEPSGATTEAALASWHGPRKESLWVRPDSRLQVDLHTRLADNPGLIPGIGMRSPRQRVDVGSGIILPTLARDELFAYLTVHGASSAWFRLKWISDFAAFTKPIPADEIEALYRRSQDLGAGRSAAQGLLLADALFGTLEHATALKRSLERDSRSRWLYRVALDQLTGRDEPIEPTSRTLGTAAIHYTQLLLLPGLGFKISEFVRQGRAALASAF